jgi:hypothetical protein
MLTCCISRCYEEGIKIAIRNLPLRAMLEMKQFRILLTLPDGWIDIIEYAEKECNWK